MLIICKIYIVLQQQIDKRKILQKIGSVVLLCLPPSGGDIDLLMFLGQRRHQRQLFDC